MDSFDMENSNDSHDKVKEKVRVVSLEDPSIIASDFASNSNNSVWSLCGLNSDDHHVDLGDISPSISPIFSEQQMADHLRERLTAEENIFTGEGNDRVALSHDTKHLTDLKGDLELFDQEIKDFDHLDDATKDGAKNYSRFGQDDEESLAKIASKLSTNKRAQNRDTILPPRTRTALRNRTRQRGQEESKKVLEKSVTRDEKPSAKNLDQSCLGDEKVTKANMSSDKDSTMTISSNGQNRSHRVTRSITGNLKPKQPFEHEERQPVQSAKSKESNKKQSSVKKSKSSETDNKDKKLKKELFTDEEISSGNDDEGSDIHEYDSDYSPEDDPDRPWCICRKPHGNKFMICCDGCEEWFHGKCVGITMEQGRQMEELGQEYVCNKCIEKKEKEQEMMKKAKELAKSIVKNRNDITTEETQKKARQKQKNSTTSVVADADSSVKLNVQSQTPTQSDEVKIKKAKEPPGFKIPKKVRTTPTPVSHVTVQVSRKCIIDGCPRNAFEGAVYCSRGCIERHAAQAMKIFSSNDSGKKLYTSEGNRVSMIEKSSGRLVAGMTAPVVTKLAEWIMKNPSFQVLFSGNSPTNHPSSSSNSKVSESKQKKEVGKKSEKDTVRSNVRRMMKDILLERKKESSDINISGEEIVKLVRQIEEDMFKAFKDTSHRYKAKYRTLMFNLKDPRNKVLYKRVLNGDIASEKLISMTSDELATKELAQWREQETKHMIDMIKKEFEGENTNKSRLLKKTHKGEVDIDGDEDLSTLVSTDIKDIEEKKPKEKVEQKVELPLLDTTEEHRSHLFDLNCKICTGKMAPPGEIVATSPTRTNAPIQAAAESSVPSPPRNEELSSYNEPLSPVIHTTPVSTDVSQKPKIETSIWKGSVTMPSVAKFGSNAFLVSGSLDNLDQVLPDMLQVAGRIAYKQVWDYVKQCRSSSSRELCVIRFVASPDEEKISYVSLYSYFHSRKRCGVVGNCHSAVKDMYLVPLASHEPVPTLLLPFNGPGMPEPRPHMLLGLLVMNKNVPVKRSRSASDRSSTKSENIEPPSKRSTASDVTVKTNKKPSDSPVDEIEDIVFHYHHTHGNKQGKSTKSGKAGKTSSGAGKNPTIPPMISALLKIQEQEKRLRELQKQSELLEKELAPTVDVSMSKVTTGSMGTSGSKIQASQKVPSLPSSVPPPLNIMSPVQLGNLASVLGVQKDAVSVPDNKPKQAGVLAKAGVNLGFPAVIGQTSVSSQFDSHRTKIAASPNVVSSVLDTSVPTIGTQGPSSTPLSKEEEPYDPETADSEDMPYDPEDMDTIDISLDEAPSPEKTTAMSSRTEATAMNTSVEGVYGTEQANVIHGVQVTENLNQNILQNALAIGALLKAAGKDSVQTKHVTTPPQPSIPKELEEKVQALLKSENTGVIQQFTGDPRVNRPEVRGSNVETREAYNFSRDFSTKEGEYPNRRGEEAKFYSSRFSLNASRRDEDDDHRRVGSHRGYNRDMRDRWDSEQDYNRDYRSRDNRGYRGDPRRWEDDRRRYDDQERNRDRNWRR